MLRVYFPEYFCKISILFQIFCILQLYIKRLSQGPTQETEMKPKVDFQDEKEFKNTLNELKDKINEFFKAKYFTQDKKYFSEL